MERGLHALKATEKGKHGRSVKAYAAEIGRAQRSVAQEVAAAEVAQVSAVALTSLADLDRYPRHLAEIHAAPRWLWAAIVERLVAEEWTIERTRRPAPNAARIAI